MLGLVCVVDSAVAAMISSQKKESVAVGDDSRVIEGVVMLLALDAPLERPAESLSEIYELVEEGDGDGIEAPICWKSRILISFRSGASYARGFVVESNSIGREICVRSMGS